MSDWNALHEYLQPKEPLYCPEEPSITQKVFLRTNAKEAFFGGAAGGGKSSALLMAALQYVDVPGYTAILFRRTYADLALPGALMDRFLDWIREYDEIRWNANTYTATFPSTARITFGYLNNIQDRLRYKSAEFQFVGMDEVTEIREQDYLFLFSRMRKPEISELSEVPLRMRAASNPAPNWVRQRFVVEGQERNIPFVRSQLKDNPGVNKPAYAEMLKELSPIERAQLEEGDWWASALGNMFKRENFEIVSPSEVPMFSNPKLVRFWDLAGTKVSAANKDPDWTVGVLMAYDKGLTYILDVKRLREDSAKVEKFIQNTALDDGPEIPIRMEKEPGSSGKSLVNMYSRTVLPGFDFQGVQATGSKATRAKPLESAVANGNVKLVEGPWIKEYLDEMSSFQSDGTGVAHDDQVDASAHAFNFVTGYSDKVRRKVRIVV